MQIIISIPLMNYDLAEGEHHQDNCYFYSINNFDWRHELAMYDYHEKERTLDLKSILADFMAYQASSKGYYYSMKQQGTQFERDYSSADYQRESQWQPDYQNEAERGSNLDKLLMQFKETTKSTQRALQRVEI